MLFFLNAPMEILAEERRENAPGGIRTRDQRLSQSSDRTRKAVMLNRATPPERGVQCFNRPFRRVSTRGQKKQSQEWNSPRRPLSGAFPNYFELDSFPVSQ